MATRPARHAGGLAAGACGAPSTPTHRSSCPSRAPPPASCCAGSCRTPPWTSTCTPKVRRSRPFRHPLRWGQKGMAAWQGSQPEEKHGERRAQLGGCDGLGCELVAAGADPNQAERRTPPNPTTRQLLLKRLQRQRGTCARRELRPSSRPLPVTTAARPAQPSQHPSIAASTPSVPPKPGGRKSRAHSPLPVGDPHP